MSLENVKVKFKELNISPQEFRPCTEEEVEKIEQSFNSPLPNVYRAFLLWIGHGYMVICDMNLMVWGKLLYNYI